MFKIIISAFFNITRLKKLYGQNGFEQNRLFKTTGLYVSTLQTQRFTS